MLKTRIAVFVSGGGTNLQALIDKQGSVINSGEICLVISSNKDAYALTRAANAGIRGETVSKKELGSQAAFEARIIELLDENRIDLIVLAGFMSILSADFTARYPERIINVHPSLIPSFCGKGMYGLRVHEAALAKGVKVTGATVHFVNEIPDGGQILAQKAVYIEDGDTAEVLQKRVMEQVEWILLPEVCEKVSKKIMEEKQMSVYNIADLKALLSDNTYPGRGIVLGTTPSGKYSVAAYFIMGRSVNSRNRVFIEEPDGIRTEAHDPSLLSDPSLIIYHPVREYGKQLIVTNGDQTDTVRDGFAEGKGFFEALETREFEPDGPNWTPRISGLVKEDGSYLMSILKSIDLEGSGCARFGYSYPVVKGLGHFIHTYVTDGNPIPTFQGEPERVAILEDMDEFTDMIWNSLNENNKISLFVRYTDLETGEKRQQIINKF